MAEQNQTPAPDGYTMEYSMDSEPGMTVGQLRAALSGFPDATPLAVVAAPHPTVLGYTLAGVYGVTIKEGGHAGAEDTPDGAVFLVPNTKSPVEFTPYNPRKAAPAREPEGEG